MGRIMAARRLAQYSTLERQIVVARVATVLSEFPFRKSKQGHSFIKEADVKVISRLMQIPISVFTDALLQLN